MTKRANRAAWGLVTVLAVVLIGGTTLLGLGLRPYWRARHGGGNLQGAFLQFAPLRGVDLTGARLSQAILRGAMLSAARLAGVDLRNADVRGADLRNAYLGGYEMGNTPPRETDLTGADFRGADLTGTDMHGAFYDGSTRWPAGFDPQQHGAVRADDLLFTARPSDTPARNPHP